MQTFYGPTKSVNGGLVSVKYSKLKDNFFLEFVKQTAFTENKAGNFKDGAKVTLKMDNNEIGGLIRAIRTNSSFKAYHQTDKGATQLTFAHFVVPAKDKYPERQGFGFSVKKDTVEIKVSLSQDAAENLMEYLKFALGYSYTLAVDAEDARVKEYLDKKGNSVKTNGREVTPANPVVPTQSSNEPEDPFDVD